MTDVAKLGRGRPIGTGKLDEPVLHKIADLLVADSSLKPTTAMKRILRTSSDWDATDETMLRRWQVKWKADSATFLEAARERAKLAVTASPPPASPPYASSTEAYVQIREATENSPYRGMVREMQRSPYLEMMQEVKAQAQMFREMQNSPQAQMLREMRCSSAFQMAREMNEAVKRLTDPFWF
jgi:hypothetical protein